MQRPSKRLMPASDDGSAFVLVLFLVLGVSIVMTGLLSLTQTGLMSGSAFQRERNVTLHNDAAMTAAINALRGSPSAGVDGAPCKFPRGTSAPVDTLSMQAPAAGTGADGADGQTYDVTCEGLPGSGGSFDSIPKHAILALGTTPSDGITINNNSVLTVDGSIVSNRDIRLLTNAQLEVYGDLAARDGCTPSSDVRATGTTECSTSATAPDPFLSDSSYAPSVDVSVSPAVRYSNFDPLGTCSDPGNVVVFRPGMYTRVPTPTAGCSNSHWWFEPGAYYFDFTTGPSTWTINNRVFAGSPIAPAGVPTLTGSSTSFALPLGCASVPDGAQFVFGGDSSISVGNLGRLEICGPSPSAGQHISVVGLRDGNRPGAASPTLLPTAATATVGIWNEPDGALIAGGTAATALVPARVGPLLGSSEIHLGGFPQNIPRGSRIIDVRVAATHSESSADLRGRFRFDVGGNSWTSAQLPSRSSLTEDAVTWTPTLADVSPYKWFDGTSPVTVTYELQNNAFGLAHTATLDALEVRVRYVPPAFVRACAASTCSPLLDSNGSAPQQHLTVHGTVYAPVSSLSVTLQAASSMLFDRGVVVRSIDITNSSSSQQTTSPFKLPEASGGRKVLFVARLNGDVKIRAVAEYTDSIPTTDGGTSAFPGRRVRIASWHVER